MRRPLRTLIFVITMIAVLVIVVAVFGCSHPLRLDPQREQLQRKQEDCLARGGNPRDCRP